MKVNTKRTKNSSETDAKGKGDRRAGNGPTPLSLTLPLPRHQNQCGRTYRLLPNLSLLIGAGGCDRPTVLPPPMSEEFPS